MARLMFDDIAIGAVSVGRLAFLGLGRAAIKKRHQIPSRKSHINRYKTRGGGYIGFDSQLEARSIAYGKIHGKVRRDSIGRKGISTYKSLMNDHQVAEGIKGNTGEFSNVICRFDQMGVRVGVDEV
jgi:hypothetical protein